MPPSVAGSIRIVFDSCADYFINDRPGTRILRDPYTNKPFAMLYATKRVWGGRTRSARDPAAPGTGEIASVVRE